MGKPARLLTAVAVIGFCAVAGFRGWEVARFSHARAAVVPSDNSSEAMQAWSTIAGVGGAALEAALQQLPEAANVRDAEKRAELVTALLTKRPLSSTLWLALAGQRLISGQPNDSVLQALTMSRLTGPNEGRLMFERGIFGLLEWGILPTQARHETIAEFARALNGMPVEDRAIAPAKHVIATKSAEERRDIADQLRAEGIAPADLARLGL